MNSTIQQAVDAVSSCKTPDEVADLMRRHGCVGIRGSSCMCPVAKYWRVVGGDPEPHVSNHMTEFTGGGRWLLTPAVAGFVRRLDRGEFSDLIDE